MATIFLEVIGVWEFVNGKTAKSNGTDTATKASWIYLPQGSKGLILFYIDRGLNPLTSIAPDVPVPRVKLEDGLDMGHPTILHTLLRTIITVIRSNKSETGSQMGKYHEL